MATKETKTKAQNDARIPFETAAPLTNVTPDNVLSQAQQSIEDLYFKAAGFGTDALEGFLSETDRHDVVDRKLPFDISACERFENHKAPFGTIDGWNVKILIDMMDRGEKKTRTLSLAANKYRDAFFTVIADGVKKHGEPIGEWGLRFIYNSSGQETYDLRPYHLLADESLGQLIEHDAQKAQLT